MGDTSEKLEIAKESDSGEGVQKGGKENPTE
jgi:hypothetical protein